MRHTPQQRARRAALADAAGGGYSVARIARVRVVLYDRQPLHGSSRPLPALRVFAEARDWAVVAAVSDTAPLEIPTMTCPLWPRVAELVESGQADGVVTSSWATDDGELMVWLRERHAFVACTDGALVAPAGWRPRAPSRSVTVRPQDAEPPGEGPVAAVVLEAPPRVAALVVSTPPAVPRRSFRRIGALAMIETGAGRMPAYTETLPRDPDSVHRARRLVRLALDVWGLPDVQDDAELVVSELLTNAVLHARRGGSVRATVTRLGEGRVRVAVVDLSKDRPAPRDAGGDQESGRGLEIVEALSGGKWGVDPLPWGKRVWATLGLEAEPDE